MLLSGTVCAAQSRDTLCFETDVIRKVLIDAEKGKVYREQVSLLNQRVVLLQGQITELKERDSANTASSQAQIKALLEERSLCQDQVKIMEQMLRKERRKRFWISTAGTVATAAAIILPLIKK